MKIFEDKKVWGKFLYTAAIILSLCCIICLALCYDDSNDDISNAAHDFGEWTVAEEPTCTRKGLPQRACKSDLSIAETEEIAPLRHEFVDVPEKPAVCTEDGCTACTECGRCGYIDDPYDIIPTLEYCWSGKDTVSFALADCYKNKNAGDYINVLSYFGGFVPLYHCAKEY